MKKYETMTLPDLPYEYAALEPIISAETLKYHHDKHHRGYVEKLNQLIVGSGFEKAPLETIVLESAGPLYEQAAQHWNHSFYWKSMNPRIKAMATQNKLFSRIKSTFGSTANFNLQFKKMGEELFGSGWLWLVSDDRDNLQILVTKNAWNPIREDFLPLLVCDLWEHAYYIDYRNARSKYLSRFCEVIDWEFAEANYADSKLAHYQNQPWTPLPLSKEAGGLMY